MAGTSRYADDNPMMPTLEPGRSNPDTGVRRRHSEWRVQPAPRTLPRRAPADTPAAAQGGRCRDISCACRATEEGRSEIPQSWNPVGRGGEGHRGARGRYRSSRCKRYVTAVQYTLTYTPSTIIIQGIIFKGVLIAPRSNRLLILWFRAATMPCQQQPSPAQPSPASPAHHSCTFLHLACSPSERNISSGTG